MMVIDAEHPEGRHLDSVRGFLVVMRGELLLTMSAADDDVFSALAQPASTAPPSTRANELKKTLLEFYATLDV